MRKVSGELDVEANEDWTLTKLEVRIDGELVAGEPSEEDVTYIVDCMQRCPASVNVNFPHGRTTISFS